MKLNKETTHNALEGLNKMDSPTKKSPKEPKEGVLQIP